MRDCDPDTYRVLEGSTVVASGSLDEVRAFLPGPPRFVIERGPYGDWQLATHELDGSTFYDNYPTRAAARAERASRLAEHRRRFNA